MWRHLMTAGQKTSLRPYLAGGHLGGLHRPEEAAPAAERDNPAKLPP